MEVGGKSECLHDTVENALILGIQKMSNTHFQLHQVQNDINR